MAVIVNSQEIIVPVSPKRMIKAMVLESHIVLPNIMSGVIKGIVLLQGDGGVGTIMQTTFSDGALAGVPTKHRIESLDIEKGSVKFTMIEGVMLGEKIESIVSDVKFEESGDGGCLIKITSEYHTKGDAVLKEDELKQSADHAKGFYTAAGEYLVANPSVCA